MPLYFFNDNETFHKTFKINSAKQTSFVNGQMDIFRHDKGLKREGQESDISFRQSYFDYEK